ncbi:class I SAM-dependent methyltransferase [Streptomyces sp. MB09-02B]|uniref:class I SAM-dependent methyltransferase n=1 Tax=Streptomyces sp. MB09-02B TaxID=3028667 RepID=UPI0029B08CE1|nr:class I SAM-dependent methyltransferase [Streptomyces sp. MB09-02B]MDX3639997.1 class I SAM-dependent methyltransferase [Streptomyces sp. MB09-02B]
MDVWDGRAGNPGLYAVLSNRWSEDECAVVDSAQKSLIERLVQDLDGRRVVDLGCGVGRLTSWVSRRAGLTVGIDRSAGMVDRAQQAVAGRPAVALRASTAQLPLPSGAFDLVLAVFTLQHVVDEEEFRASVREMGRVAARPGGELLIVDGHNPTSAAQDVSSRTTTTVVRPLDAYGDLTRYADRVAVEEQEYVGDRYLAQVWRTR